MCGSSISPKANWSVADPQIVPLNFKEGTKLLVALVESEFGEKMDLSNVDDSRDGQSLFSEKIIDQFGFNRLSVFDKGTKAPKSTETVALYDYLIEQLHAEINLTEDGRLERDDWVRLADHA